MTGIARWGGGSRRVALGLMMAASLGTAVGLLVGYCRGWVEVIGLRVIDSFLAFPALLLAMAVAVAAAAVAALGREEQRSA